MKTMLADIHTAESPGSTVRRPRYQIYRQGPAGYYHPEFGTDSASEAVEAFLAAKPIFEGGALHDRYTPNHFGTPPLGVEATHAIESAALAVQDIHECIPLWVLMHSNTTV